LNGLENINSLKAWFDWRLFFGCQENLCFLDVRHAVHGRHKKIPQKWNFLRRNLSCQSVSDEHFEHPKVLVRLQEGLFEREQISCAQSVDRILKTSNHQI